MARVEELRGGQIWAGAIGFYMAVQRGTGQHWGERERSSALLCVQRLQRHGGVGGRELGGLGSLGTVVRRAAATAALQRARREVGDDVFAENPQPPLFCFSFISFSIQ